MNHSIARNSSLEWHLQTVKSLRTFHVFHGVDTQSYQPDTDSKFIIVNKAHNPISHHAIACSRANRAHATCYWGGGNQKTNEGSVKRIFTYPAQTHTR